MPVDGVGKVQRHVHTEHREPVCMHIGPLRLLDSLVSWCNIEPQVHLINEELRRGQQIPGAGLQSSMQTHIRNRLSLSSVRFASSNLKVAWQVAACSALRPYTRIVEAHGGTFWLCQVQ